MPLTKMREWIEREKELGSTDPERVVLATATIKGRPHSRVVASIIEPDSIIFFTQRDTRKEVELRENPFASMTCWLAMQQREIILDGFVKPLTRDEIEKQWEQLPRERQLRFSAYGPISGQPIDSLDDLEKRQTLLTTQFSDQAVPVSEFYCGFRLVPDTLYFYTLGNETFSEVVRYTKRQTAWQLQLVSP